MPMLNLSKNTVSVSVKRRDFIRVAVAAGIATALTETGADEAIASNSRPKVCVYTEQFQSLTIPDVCQVFQEMGVDGLDVTVRPGGHIEPRDTKIELPKAARAARDHGLEIMM
ncbi:MAG: hypothetical protein O7F71_10395, partial [Gammaproteobacteria bacterium]|nr:hypothetical protein [Gammaproteobacteria bacterium]